MRQYSEILKQHADCSVRTMETGDHFKNGASPKSQTSKRNHLKKFNLLLLAALCFCAFTNKANAAWTGDGDGTTGDPWQIGDGETNTAPAVKAKLVGSALTVFGTGNMADFWDSTDGEAPWHSVSSNITTVVIESGVTNIG
ncbi:MAG: hypothetical protein LBT50_09405, partial [Prevotellaceae bacterium]|nr:hypothetical protein [Prevotellaceae bacterium]